MLSSARQGCSHALPRLAPRLSCFLSLPAESSRQAILRLAAQARSSGNSAPQASGMRRRVGSSREAHGMVKFSAAAAAVEAAPQDTDEPMHVYRRGHKITPHWTRRDTDFETPPTPRPPDPPDPPDRKRPQAAGIADPRDRPRRARVPESHTVKLSELETFRGLIGTRPLDALQELHDLPPTVRDQLRVSDFDSLLHDLYRYAETKRPSSKLESASDPETRTGLHIHAALAIIPDLLNSKPTNPYQGDHSLGFLLRSRRLTAFLRVCVAFGAMELATSVFRERLAFQQGSGQDIVDVGAFAEILNRARAWRTTVLVFSHPSLPWSAWSPTVHEAVLRAKLALRQPEEVPPLFAKHTELGFEPTISAWSSVTQAHLSLGDIESAKAVTAEARKRGKVTVQSQQMAILRGHRALGLDEALETKVLNDVLKLDVEPDAGVLNALIRLRLDQHDLDGARELLEYFAIDFDADPPFVLASARPTDSPFGTKVTRASGASEPRAKLAPTHDTVYLAFQFLSRRDDLKKLRQWWPHVMGLQSDLVDKILIAIIYTLGRGAMSSVAYDIVRSAAKGRSPGSVPDDRSWPIPSNFTPGVRSLNALLGVFARDHGFSGLVKVAALYPKLRVLPDDSTVRTILNFARTQEKAEPLDLANLLGSLLISAPHLQPTVQQLDLVMHHAISHSVGLDSRRRRYPDEVHDTSHDSILPSGGLVTRNPFRTAMLGIMRSLRARGVRSTSHTLANRLQFDAQQHSLRGSRGLLSARAVWADLVARGFRPTKRHLLSLMKGYAKAGAMEEAEEVLELAGTLDAAQTVGMYMVLVSGWGRAGYFQNAYSAYTAIKKMPFGPDLPAITAILQAAIQSARFQTALHIVEHDLKFFLEQTGTKLDHKAAILTCRALRANGLYGEALDCVRSVGPALSAPLRQEVMALRNWCGKMTGLEDVVVGCQAVLEADRAARPQTRVGALGEGISTRTATRKLLRAFRGQSPRGRGGRKRLRRLQQSLDEQAERMGERGEGAAGLEAGRTEAKAERPVGIEGGTRQIGTTRSC